MSRFGKIGDQYGDDDLNPLINGKLYFYESGTNTAKDTFADANLSVLNTNPVILTAAGRQPNVFYNGSARVILTKSDETQIEFRDPEGGDTGSGQFESWNALTIYSEGDIVIGSDGKYYLSFTNNNQGNDPSITPTEWEEVQFVKIWNISVTYDLNATTKGSDGIFYRSLISSNVGNDPVTGDGTKWGAPIPVQESDIALIQAQALSF